MFTLVTGIVGRWRGVCVTAPQRPNSDAAAIRIVVGIAAASLSVTTPHPYLIMVYHYGVISGAFSPNISAHPQTRPPGYIGGFSTALQNAVDKPLMPVKHFIHHGNVFFFPLLVQSSVCSKIVQLLGQNEVDHHQKQVVMISQDSFYCILTPEQKSKALKGQFNFDHPDAFDNELILKTLQELMEGKTVQIPVYDFVTHSRLTIMANMAEYEVTHKTDFNLMKEESVTVYPADVILFEGILAFYVQDIRDMFQMKLFVDTDADTRLSRRVLRDINERGRDLEQVLSQYIKFVKPAFEEFCLPTKKYADVIIPRGADNLELAGIEIGRHVAFGEPLMCLNSGNPPIITETLIPTHAAFVTVLRKKIANESLWKPEKYGLHTDQQCDLREIRSGVREKSAIQCGVQENHTDSLQ
ncbi:unnamed protein product [Ranitomeya imitator]|uniref:uridine/cytidine kinase n=1 Tax=Ranitomeya imitator TaxID=111125 RepID=A0ABN9M7G1_9NEOB|nr:unnamed protein product [Ranitomeya imitator]